MRCASPTCNHKGHDGDVIISGKCHRGGATRVIYFHGGVLVVGCFTCGLWITEIRVCPEFQATFDAQV